MPPSHSSTLGDPLHPPLITSANTDDPEAAWYLDCAHELADVAGSAILPYFRRSMAVDNKASASAFDPVTSADREAELAIRTLLAERLPDHGMIGEEFGETNPSARFKWIVDPIDGTRSFIMGLPTWGTLIALLDHGTPILGLMDQPFTGERYYATDTTAQLRHGGRASRLHTRPCPGLTSAVVSSTHPDLFEGPHHRKMLNALGSSARMLRYGGDCYAYCQLAAGNIDAIVEPGLQSYDIAALIPIVEAAGGRITTWCGRPATQGGDVVAAGDPRLHAEILELIATV